MAILDTHFTSLALSPSVLLALAFALLGGLYVLFVQRESFPSSAPAIAHGSLPVFGQIGYWTERYDFWLRALSQSKTKNFSFYLGKYRVIGTDTDSGRKAFFESKDLDFSAGYAVLFGQAPNFEDPTDPYNKVSATSANAPKIPYFSRRLTAMLKTDRFQKFLPTLVSDVKSRLRELKDSGDTVTNPFDSIYKIVYLLTMRAVGPTEIAESREMLDKTLHLFEQIEQSTRPYQIMFPWLPSPALVKRYIAGSRLYMIFNKIVELRKSNTDNPDDTLQYLVDQGDDVLKVINFTVGAVFAGQINSGINAAWVLCYLATSPHWLAEVRKEVEAVAEKYHPGSSAPLADRLTGLPLEAWETEFPIVDLCLRDSIRLQVQGTGMRRNISGHSVSIGDEAVPPDAFLLYHFANHHLDPAVYADPLAWDPARYMPGRAEDKKAPYAFIGWGAGRHPCLGMRFAKLEQNIIAAFFVALFDFELLDHNLQVLAAPPPVNYNNWTAAGPEKKVHLRFKVREGAM